MTTHSENLTTVVLDLWTQSGKHTTVQFEANDLATLNAMLDSQALKFRAASGHATLIDDRGMSDLDLYFDPHKRLH